MTANAATDLVTIRDFIRYAVSRFNAAELFFGHGSDNAWDEAVYLTQHTLNLLSKPLKLVAPVVSSKKRARLRND